MSFVNSIPNVTSGVMLLVPFRWYLVRRVWLRWNPPSPVLSTDTVLASCLPIVLLLDVPHIRWRISGINAWRLVWIFFRILELYNWRSTYYLRGGSVDGFSSLSVREAGKLPVRRLEKYPFFEQGNMYLFTKYSIY